jgi:hypothetical protein
MTLLAALPIVLGALGEEVLRWLLHHRTGLTAALTGVTGWTWHHTRRAFISPGTRVAGRDTPQPRPAREAATA